MEIKYSSHINTIKVEKPILATAKRRASLFILWRKRKNISKKIEHFSKSHSQIYLKSWYGTAEQLEPIAYNEGLVKGYPDCTFRPKQALTNGEALLLMLNIIDKDW